MSRRKFHRYPVFFLLGAVLAGCGFPDEIPGDARSSASDSRHGLRATPAEPVPAVRSSVDGNADPAEDFRAEQGQEDRSSRDNEWPPEWGEAPSLGISDELLDNLLNGKPQMEAERSERARAQWSDFPPRTLKQTVRAVEECYREGVPNVAHDIIESHAALYEWHQATDMAETSAVFRRSPFGQGILEVTVKRRPGVQGALAVAVPPGTVARPIQDRSATRPPSLDGPWRVTEPTIRGSRFPQDLALLRAQVLRLGTDRKSVRVLVPIACASFGRPSPSPEQPYELTQLPPGSAMEKVLVELCATKPESGPGAQVAVWMVRDDMSWDEFQARGLRGGLRTFDGARVLPVHSHTAAQILIRAGVDPRRTSFFGDPAPPVRHWPVYVEDPFDSERDSSRE